MAGVGRACGTMTFLAQHFQLVNGLSPLGAGLAMVPGMASSIVSFQLAALLGRRIRPARLFPAGLAITLAGMIMITQSAGTAALATGFAIACLGTGPLVSLGVNLIVGSVPPQKAGAAAGLAQTCNECGLPLGVALLGSAGLLAYRAYLSAHPTGLPRVAARHAFTTELHVIAAIAAVGLAGTAIMLAAGLRHLPALGHAEPGPGPGPPTRGRQAPARDRRATATWRMSFRREGEPYLRKTSSAESAVSARSNHRSSWPRSVLAITSSRCASDVLRSRASMILRMSLAFASASPSVRPRSMPGSTPASAQVSTNSSL